MNPMAPEPIPPSGSVPTPAAVPASTQRKEGQGQTPRRKRRRKRQPKKESNEPPRVEDLLDEADDIEHVDYLA